MPTFALKDDEEQSVKGAHPLFKAPEFPLTLPQARTRAGAAQTTRDLTGHPWAGAKAEVTLVARDEAGNEGRSQTVEFQLPQRIFVKPVARALIEQRRILALDANAKPLVLTALDALTIAPEKFTPEVAVYLGLRSIYYDLAHANTDDQLREVVARMWDMAMQLEDGNVSQAEQALRAAQDALRQALERGATDQELKKLMDQLRAAMDKYPAGAGRGDAEKSAATLASARPQYPHAQPARPQEHARPAGKPGALRQQGGRAPAARRITVDAGKPADGAARRTRRPGRRRHDVGARRTGRHDPQAAAIARQDLQAGPGHRGATASASSRAKERAKAQQFGDLRQDQQALRDRLNKLLEQLRQHGLGSLGQDQQSQGKDNMGQLGDAGEAMGEAEGELGQGDADSAVDSQGRALEAMRKGAQGLAQQMQQDALGMGPGPGQPGRRGRARAQQDTDPLGRPLRGREYGDDVTVKVPGEIDAQRARRILEELRKRFGESGRPQLELDYIERLLKDF